MALNRFLQTNVRRKFTKFTPKVKQISAQSKMDKTVRSCRTCTSLPLITDKKTTPIRWCSRTTDCLGGSTSTKSTDKFRNQTMSSLSFSRTLLKHKPIFQSGSPTASWQATNPKSASKNTKLNSNRLSFTNSKTPNSCRSIRAKWTQTRDSNLSLKRKALTAREAQMKTRTRGHGKDSQPRQQTRFLT